MLIKEQIRKYKIKMEEINQLEAAESFAFRRLSLLRQNTVSVEIKLQLLGERVLLLGRECCFCPSIQSVRNQLEKNNCPKLWLEAKYRAPLKF